MLTVAWCVLTVAGHVWTCHMNEGRVVSRGGPPLGARDVHVGDMVGDDRRRDVRRGVRRTQWAGLDTGFQRARATAPARARSPNAT